MITLPTPIATSATSADAPSREKRGRPRPKCVEGEHRQRSADEAADVAADRDVAQHERQGEVDGDDEQRLTAEHVDAAALEHEAGAEDPEHRTRGADGGRRGRDEKRSGRAGEGRDEVDADVARRADDRLERSGRTTRGTAC